MARLLVTGAASFTASHLLPLVTSAHDVFGTDVAPAGPSGVRYERVDLTDRAAARALLETVRPERVLHLAGVAGADRDLCFRVNLDGARNLLEAAARLESPPHVVLVSSSAVYGFSRPEETPLGETTPLRPVSGYGASKAAAEAAALSLHRLGLLRVTVARPFNLIGPGLGKGLAPADFLGRILAIRRGDAPPVLRTGNLTPLRDYVDGRDAAAAYAALLDRPDLAGGIFNVASGRAVAIADLVAAMVRAAGITVTIEEDPALMRPVEVREQTGDATLLRDAVGWTARYSLEDSVRDMVGAAD